MTEWSTLVFDLGLEDGILAEHTDLALGVLLRLAPPPVQVVVTPLSVDVQAQQSGQEDEYSAGRGVDEPVLVGQRQFRVERLGFDADDGVHVNEDVWWDAVEGAVLVRSHRLLPGYVAE